MLAARAAYTQPAEVGSLRLGRGGEAVTIRAMTSGAAAFRQERPNRDD